MSRLFHPTRAAPESPESANSTPRRPALPPGLRIYALTDIHGHADLLEQALAIIADDHRRAPAARMLHVFMGDYIDRGPDSRRTLDLLIEWSASHESVFLAGNHEAVLLDVRQDPAGMAHWCQYGGLQTMRSYGMDVRAPPRPDEHDVLGAELRNAIPPDHWAFLERLDLSYACGDFFFVHGGVRPGVALDAQAAEDLLWIREEFLQSEMDFGKFIVHGHTPVAKPDIRRNRANIDTGSYFTGNLTLLKISGTELQTLTVRSESRRHAEGIGSGGGI